MSDREPDLTASDAIVAGARIQASILLCCTLPLDPRKGTPKHYIELADAFRNCGWRSSAIGPETWGPGVRDFNSAEARTALRDYLRKESANWDVVQYDYLSLPFPRIEFPATTLMTAMSTLLIHGVEAANIPPRPRLKSRLGHLLLGGRRRRRLRETIRIADETICAADLVTMSTQRDADLLAARGHRREKLLVVPLGISADRRPLYEAISDEIPGGPPIVGFVGTFDPRKGMCDFPDFAERLFQAVPDARLRLLGTAGMIEDVTGVLYSFRRRHRSRVEVVPRYEPDRLPELLADCWVGVFPSLVEGFGYGVLEMMAAAVPVVAYDVTGPSAMLSKEMLAPVRDVRGLAERVVRLLRDRDALAAARRAARERSRDFAWEDIARRMCADYWRALDELRRRRG